MTSEDRPGLSWEYAGVQIEVQHHEVSTACRTEIDMRFETHAG